jgi:hypothetical protein
MGSRQMRRQTADDVQNGGSWQSQQTCVPVHF